MKVDRIGEILMERGLLGLEQVEEILTCQQQDTRPFGEIAAERFGVEPFDVWESLAEQVLRSKDEVNLINEPFDPECLKLIHAQDAWDYLILPLRVENDQLVCATTVETLPNAFSLVCQRSGMPFRFVLAEIRPLEQFIAERYDYEGIEVTDSDSDTGLGPAKSLAA